MKLGNVATVRSGLVLSRKQSKESTNYSYKLLSIRSINSSGYINVENVDIYNAVEDLNKDYLSQAGDVVVRLSAPYTAVLINNETAGMIIPSYFAIIRPNLNYVLPEYLYWLLNTQKIKQLIFKNTSSNVLGAIRPLFFRDFEMSPISIENQKKIAKLNLLAHREYQLLNELVVEKEKFYSHAIDKIQKQMSGGTENDN